MVCVRGVHRITQNHPKPSQHSIGSPCHVSPSKKNTLSFLWWQNSGQVGPESSRPGSTRPGRLDLYGGPGLGGRVVRLEGGCICMSICLSVNLMD